MVREYRNHFLFLALKRAEPYREGSMCQWLKDIELSAYNNVDPPKYQNQRVGRKPRTIEVLAAILGTEVTPESGTWTGGMQLRKVDQGM